MINFSSIMIFEEILVASGEISLLGFRHLTNDSLNLFNLFESVETNVMTINDNESEISEDEYLLRELGLVPTTTNNNQGDQFENFKQKDEYYNNLYMAFYEHLNKTLVQYM